ncbi:amidohydrolase [Brevibacillus fluminis]|uniref:amidohydrolase n=1 Tax=Brevibacillus fluminis TaxID=511487 RepID=UPI003F886F56
MKKRTFSGVLLTALLLGAGFAQAAPAAPAPAQVSEHAADLVFQNGSVYTVDKNRNWAQAVAVKGDTIVFVGSNSDVRAYIGPKTKVVDLAGKMLLPGFFDAHAHASETVKQVFQVNLFGLESVDAYKKAIKDFIAANPKRTFITGMGWSNTVVPGKGPDKAWLDEISKQIPIVLTSEDGHSYWVNSKALELANITKTTKNPAGGIIERDANGDALGTLRDSAKDLLDGLIPATTVDEYTKGLEIFEKMANERGITGVHEPMVGGKPVIEAYKNLEKADKLTIRFRNSLVADPALGMSQVPDLVKVREENKGPLFQVNTVKIFLDGVIEGSTGYLKEKYHNVDSHGEVIWDPFTYKTTAAALDHAGFQLHHHAIGDAAVALALDGIEFAEAENGKRDARHAITHMQLVSPEDVPRFKKDGVVAVAQPFWAFKEPGYYNDIQVPYLGQERAEKEYPIKGLINLGVPLASSSDFPVTQEFGPLHSIETGVTRLPEGSASTDPADILWPEERATLADMIASVTINGAYHNFVDDITGSIELGKKADLVVLDKNLFNIPANQIHTAKVLLTMLGGKAVYQDASFK